MKLIKYQIVAILFTFIFFSCEDKPNPGHEPEPEPEQNDLSRFYAPEILNVSLPVNPYNCLFRDKDGQIRYYSDEGFLYSLDNGLTWKTRKFTDGDAMGIKYTGKRPLGMNPVTKTCIRIVSGGDGTKVQRSVDGADGKYTIGEGTRISDLQINMIRQPYFLPSNRAIIVAAQTPRPMQVAVFRSVDDGITWTSTVLPVGPTFVIQPPHEGPRFENWCCEPTVVELNDGRLWMLARTSQDEHYESFSSDVGKTWSEWQPSRFYGTLTMPILLRLSDNRIVLFWNNTTPLPEVDRTDYPISENMKNGYWEDVFTNRDVSHVAISEDDGKTWIGFRELRLNPYRNASNFTDLAVNDFSVHQGEAMELDKNKIFVVQGQNERVREMMIFDTEWIYEPRRSSSFENNLDDWSTFKYIEGIKAHHAYNRTDGPKLIPHPDKPDAKVLQVKHPIDPNLVFDKDGAVWNFPSAVNGTFTTRIKLLPNGGGAQICLLDRWFNPTDPVVADYSMYVLKIPGNGDLGNNIKLIPGQWHEITFDWTDSKSSECKLLIDGTVVDLKLPNMRSSINGISYVHFQASSDEEDLNGFLIESVEGGKK